MYGVAFETCVCTCLVFLCISCMWIFHDFNFFYFLIVSLRRDFGMSSNLWWYYRLLVLGSITYSLKPFSSEDPCFRVTPGTCATLRTRLGLWEQLAQSWKAACVSSDLSLRYCLPCSLPKVMPVTLQAQVIFSWSHLFC